jgi:hypothetical protein
MYLDGCQSPRRKAQVLAQALTRVSRSCARATFPGTSLARAWLTLARRAEGNPAADPLCEPPLPPPRPSAWRNKLPSYPGQRSEASLSCIQNIIGWSVGLCLKLLSMLSPGRIKSQEHFAVFAGKTFCKLWSRNAGANNDGRQDQAFPYSSHSGFPTWS